jgi:hypothetical protein
MWGEEKAREMLAAAGLEVLEVKQAEGDPINNFYIARKPQPSESHKLGSKLVRDIRQRLLTAGYAWS